jgi:putative endonuclease
MPSLYYKFTIMKSKKTAVNKSWMVYILRCKDKSLYTGITNDIEKRIAAHQKGSGAKYTRSRRPVELIGKSVRMTRKKAMRLEIEIKKMPKEKKIAALS